MLLAAKFTGGIVWPITHHASRIPASTHRASITAALHKYKLIPFRGLAENQHFSGKSGGEESITLITLITYNSVPFPPFLPLHHANRSSLHRYLVLLEYYYYYIAYTA